MLSEAASDTEPRKYRQIRRLGLSKAQVRAAKEETRKRRGKKGRSAKPEIIHIRIGGTHFNGFFVGPPTAGVNPFPAPHRPLPSFSRAKFSISCQKICGFEPTRAARVGQVKAEFVLISTSNSRKSTCIVNTAKLLLTRLNTFN
ncbi:hypothetical protein ACFE04_000023 [Oxalis oulophora]